MCIRDRAYTVAKRANLINLGIEGQLYIGALGTTVVALLPLISPPLSGFRSRYCAA